MKKHGMTVLILALCVALLAVTVWQEKASKDLHNQILELTETVEQQARETDVLRQELESVRKEVQETEVSCRISVAEVDTARRELLLDITVVSPEVWPAEVVAHRPESDPVENYLWRPAYLDKTGEGVYEGQMILPLDLESPVVLTMVYSDGENMRGRELASYGSMEELLPVQLVYYNGETIYNAAGDGMMYHAHCEVAFEDPAGEPVEVQQPVYRVYKNGSLALEASCQNFEIEGKGMPCIPGDRVEMRVVCRDRFGIGYEFPLKNWEITPAGKLLERWPACGVPTLYWPD